MAWSCSSLGQTIKVVKHSLKVKPQLFTFTPQLSPYLGPHTHFQYCLTFFLSEFETPSRGLQFFSFLYFSCLSLLFCCCGLSPSILYFCHHFSSHLCFPLTCSSTPVSPKLFHPLSNKPFQFNNPSACPTQFLECGEILKKKPDTILILMVLVP